MSIWSSACCDSSVGLLPGLGFVHVGHERSFVYDIADLYKAELSIPVAFETAASHPEDIGSATRRNIRDAIYDLSLLKRMVKDIRMLLGSLSPIVMKVPVIMSGYGMSK